jgi:hypothetical protein
MHAPQATYMASSTSNFEALLRSRPLFSRLVGECIGFYRFFSVFVEMLLETSASNQKRTTSSRSTHDATFPALVQPDQTKSRSVKVSQGSQAVYGRYNRGPGARHAIALARERFVVKVFEPFRESPLPVAFYFLVKPSVMIRL